MKKLIVIAAMIAAFGLGGAAAFAASSEKPSDNPGGGGGNDGQVCPGGDSGKIDVSSGSSVTVTAADGKLISGYCVKAGSANQGLGPEFVAVSPPQKTVTISHSSGKDVSHYSLTYVDEEQPTTTETTPTETTPTETTPTETTPTETTPTTPTESTPTETTSTETTPAETTVSVSEGQQSSVFTPPAQQVKSGQSGPAAVADPASPASATRPGKAAQPAPFTP